MIDWCAVKQAAERVGPLTSRLVNPAGSSPEVLQGPSRTPTMAVPGKIPYRPAITPDNITETDNEDPFLNRNPRWDADAGWNRNVHPGFPGSFRTVNIPGPAFSQEGAVNYSDIRSALYGPGKENMAMQDERDALEARWRRIGDLFPDQQSQKAIAEYRRLGYRPPIMFRPRNSMDLYDVENYFRKPDDYVRFSMRPSAGRSYYDPETGRAYIGGTYGQLNDSARHELAHAITDVSNQSSSIADGIQAGDMAAFRSQLNPDYVKGAYEADPRELARLIALQKAAVRQRGDALWRNVNDWLTWNRGLRDSSIDRSGALIQNAPKGFANGNRDVTTASPGESADATQLIRVYDNLEKKMNDPSTTQEQRDYYKEQLLQMREAIQDAIDMAAVGANNKEGVYA